MDGMENTLNARTYGVASINNPVVRPGTPRPPATHGPNGSGNVLSANLVTDADRNRGWPSPCIPVAGVANQRPSPSKRARKQRAENWMESEVMVLCEAKCIVSDEEECAPDGHALMIPDSRKWDRISIDVKRGGASPCSRDGGAYKSKWNLIIQEFKQIVDFHARSSNNEMSFWHLTPSQRKSENLPRLFHEDVFTYIHGWYGKRPTIKPPHTRDLLAPGDSNYKPSVSTSEHMQQEQSSRRDDDDPFNVPTPTSSDCNGVQCTQPISKVKLSKDRLHSSGRTALQRPVSVRPKGYIPVGVTPILLSSSENTANVDKLRGRSTGVRQKSVSGHALIAEATKASRDSMTEQLKDLTHVTSEAEKNKNDL